MEADTGFIYGLVDPRDGALRYVGQTRRSVEIRYAGHLCERHSDSPKCIWVRELRGLGLKPVVVTLGECPIEELGDAEIAAICGLRAIGAMLLNVSEGGGFYACRPKSTVAWNQPEPEFEDDAAANRKRQAAGWGSLPDGPELPRYIKHDDEMRTPRLARLRRKRWRRWERAALNRASKQEPRSTAGLHDLCEHKYAMREEE